MTRVAWGWAGGEWYLRARGHAGYGGGGPDIVCAAVSVLCCSLSGALAQACPVRETRAAGEFELWAKPRGAFCRGVMHTALTGFRLLAEKYPEHVTLR